MYHQRLDTPPPTSQFRRPWSPDPYDPLPSTLNARPDFSGYPDLGQDQEYSRYPSQQRQRREPSDVSVEALDLADYAQTLRTRQADPYSADFPPEMYPPPPAVWNPSQPPSLVSRGDTLTSNTHSTRTSHRPFSLPPSSRYPSNAHHASHEPTRTVNDPEIDISTFPPWSRGWFNTPSVNDDIYTSIPRSHLKRPSPFDPGYTHKFSFPHSSDSYGSNYLPTSSFAHGSREMLPWRNDPPGYAPIDDSMKAERMRMLEREFGAGAYGKGQTGFPGEDEQPIIGSVDNKGRLVTQGPKKRSAVRGAQVLLSLAAAIPSIYGALVIKSEKPPPPAGKPPAFALYILSVITFLLLSYLFVIRPCFCSGKRPRKSDGGPGMNGMMVLPVQGLPGGKKNKKKGGRHGRGKQSGDGGDVQVNLIVDPGVFGGRRHDEDESEEEPDRGTWDTDGYDSGSVPGAYGSGMGGRRKKRARPRRSIFAGLAIEEEWKRARAWAKKLAIVDVVGVLLWGAVFVLILLGKRCPSGGFEGWCNAYNVSSAAACLLCIAFGVSTFFDIKDLSASKVSPRTRT